MQLQVDGKTVYAATGGRPFEKGPPTIVFVHGGDTDHTVWALQTRYFAHRGHNVLAFDLPGHGRSHGPALSSIEEMSAWLIRALDVLDVEKAAIIGHSMGSLVALHTAITHRDRVCALALLGTSLPMPVSEPLLAAAKANDPAAYDMITLWGHSRSSQIGGNTAPGLWMTGNCLRLLEKSEPDVLYKDLKACNDYKCPIENVSAIRCLTLVLIGTKDAMTPKANTEALATNIPNARIVELDGSGHMMMAEQPDQVLDALKKIM